MSVNPSANPATPARTIESPTEAAELKIIIVSEAGGKVALMRSPQREGILGRIIRVVVRGGHHGH